MFAYRLLYNQDMPPKPELASHTLSHFLDRFVYRNAKAGSAGPRGSSIMQPLAGGDSRTILLSSRATRGKQESVNSEAFWNKKMEDVAVDEVFFHRYFSQVGKVKQDAGGNNVSLRSSEQSEDLNEGAENEDEIWQALVDSRPEVEGDSEGDSDLEIFDSDDSDTDSASGESGIENGDAEDAEFDESDGLGLDLSQEGHVPSSLGLHAGSQMDELFEKELERGSLSKSGEDEDKSSRQKRRKLKNLPIFASIDDYADMLDD